MLLGARKERDIVEGWAQFALPRDDFIIDELHEQVEFFSEQRVVVIEVIAEQREAFDEGATASHDLGTAVRDTVERRELLEDADRVFRAQHGDGTGEADAAGARRTGGKRNDGRRHGIIRTMVLAHTEDIEADLVGKFHFRDQLAQALRVGATGGHIREGIDADFHEASLSGDLYVADTVTVQVPAEATPR